MICLRTRRWDCVERLHERFDHHGGLLQCVVPSSPPEPNDALPGGDVLRIVEIQSVQASSAWLPPPAALSMSDKEERKRNFIITCRWPYTRLNDIPWACWRNSTSFCHYLDYTSRTDCCWSRTTGRWVSRQHFLRNRQSRACSSRLLNVFWSANTARICNYIGGMLNLVHLVGGRACRQKLVTDIDLLLPSKSSSSILKA